MQTVKSLHYTLVTTQSISAIRYIDEVPSGCYFKITISVHGRKLNDGYVLNLSHIDTMVNGLNRTNLNEVMSPMTPTLENIAKFVGQAILDYMFRMDIEDVWLDNVRVQELPGTFVDLRYEYEGAS